MSIEIAHPLRLLVIPVCCAAVLCGHILPRLRRGSQKRVLFAATGALMSQTTFLQKESIPAVAHLVELRAPEKELERLTVAAVWAALAQA